MVVITPAAFDGPAGQELTAAYHQELRARFPADYDPARGLPATARDLTPPRGVFLVAQDRDLAIGCGGLKTLDAATGEIKHMFVRPTHRGQGIGAEILRALEHHGDEHGFSRLVLDTSEYLTEAVALYRRTGYLEIEPYNSNHYATHWFEKHFTKPQSAPRP
jgi:GNAT superfamily N-acetyltransferase